MQIIRVFFLWLMLLTVTSLYGGNYITIGLTHYESAAESNPYAHKTVLYIRGYNGGSYYLYDVVNKEIVYHGNSTKEISVYGSGVTIAGVGSYTGEIDLVSDDKIVELSTDGSSFSSYRGYLRLMGDGTYLKILNKVTIEDYLLGVVASEMSYTEPVEALKSQAVVARTYALKNLGRHSSDGFDLCPLTHCQVYRGIEGEHSTTTEAVSNTSGVVVKSGGSLIDAYYFSTCGGHTANNEDVWSGSARSYLRSIADNDGGNDYCHTSSTYTWTYSTTRRGSGSLEERLKANANTAPNNTSSTLESVIIATTDVSGRAKYIDINYKSPDEVVNVRGSTFRSVVGSSLLKSTLITNLSQSGNDITFKGKGYGHGIGMCQEGSAGRAVAGQSFEQILKAYYTGVTIETQDLISPEIVHSAVTYATLATAVPIEADVRDDSGVANVFLYYKKHSDTIFASNEMKVKSGVIYTNRIPSNFVVSNGVDYYIKSIDLSGNEAYYPTHYPVPNHIAIFNGWNFSGVVLAADSKSKISDARVSISSNTIITSEDGVFIFKLLSTGHYLLRVEKVGYKTFETNIYIDRTINNFSVLMESFNDMDELNKNVSILTPNSSDSKFNTLRLTFKISPDIPEKGSLQIISIKGEIIFNSEVDIEGDSSEVTVLWDGRDKGGKIVPAGVYVYNLKVGKEEKHGIIVVAK